MMRLHLVLTAATLLGWSTQSLSNPEPVTPIAISDFKQGLIEFDNNGQPRIYKEGTEFIYEENGKCVAAGREYPCQWRGFQFSYNSSEEVTVVECTTISDRPQTHANPEAVVAKHTQTARWGFTLQGRTGHYIRPQYTLNFKNIPLRMATTCISNGREVLSWEFTLRPPSALSTASPGR
jgi:hypothetical protein